MADLRSTHVRYPGGPKAAYGVVAYVLGYLLAYVLASGRVDHALASTTVEVEDGTATAAELLAADGVSVATWQGVGWLFYNAHAVSTQLPGTATGRAIVEVNLLARTGGYLYLLVLVPVVTLVAAGAMVTRDVPVTHDLRYDFGTGGTRYAINGGLVTMLGYMPLAFVGTIVFAHGYSGAIGPGMLGGWVVAGGLVPLVFGGIGGYVGRRLARRGWEPPTETRKTRW